VKNANTKESAMSSEQALPQDAGLADPSGPLLLEPVPVSEAALVEPTLPIEQPRAVPPPKARPVQPQERVAAVDVLRGVALMGILAMNIVMFAWPDPRYDNPRAGNNNSTLDLVVWGFNHVVFDEKMMTLFSMLFGAGLVLMSERTAARGASLAGVYYRRVSWLLVIGLIHAYFIWHGDILVLYAECGFLLYLFRRWSPRRLIALGALCLLLPVLLGTGVSLVLQMSHEGYWGVRRPAVDVLSTVGNFLNGKITPDPARSAKSFEEMIEVYRGHYHGNYYGIVRHRAGHLILEQTLGFALVTLWMVGGRMLVGMGLMKLDVFSAKRSPRFYKRMMIFGYGLGLPVVAYDTWLRITNNFEGAGMILPSFLYGYLSALAIAMGHVGAVMLIYQSGAVPWLTRRLAAAGRMALSNYLMQSLICTTLFYGYGCWLYATFNRLTLAGIVVAIWVLQLSTSIIWLRFFRYGPAEWVWRSLTYWKPQPMVVRASVAESTPAAQPETVTAELPVAAGAAAIVD
jgi:uncharacterized protein